MGFSTPDIDYVLEAIMMLLSQFYHSWFFFAVKVFVAIYSIVLLVDIILLLMLRGVAGNIRTGLLGMDMPAVTKGKMQKRWDKVKSRLQSGNESQFKVAIIEADSIVDQILAGIGYPGANMSERLSQIKPSQLDYLDELIKAHQIRNQIVHDERFAVSKEMVEETVGIYETILRYLEFL